MSKNTQLISVLLYSIFIASSAGKPSPCLSSSCGGVTISYPFRLAADPPDCGHPDPIFKLQCRENTTILESESESKRFRVHSISYTNYTIKVSDLGLDSRNYSSCPLYSTLDSFFYTPYISSGYSNSVEVYTVNCNEPVKSLSYVENRFCRNHSSGIFSYFVVAEIPATDGACSWSTSTITLVSREILSETKINGSYPLEMIHDYMAAGIDLTWYLGTRFCLDCQKSKGRCLFSTWDYQISCSHICYEDAPYEDRSFRCKLDYYGVLGVAVLVVASFIGLRFILGVVFVIVVVIWKWRKKKTMEVTDVW